MSMKKKIITFMMIGMFLFPCIAKASQIEEKDYKTLNLEEVLTEENLEHDLSGYQENDKQTIIYLFRGNGCSFCRSFLTFLNSIVPEYGNYFRVVSYETWYDVENSTLMKEVASFLKTKADGVPFIIIGDKYFLGYTSSYDDAIKEAIMEQYESETKYNVIEKLNEAKANGTFVYEDETDNGSNDTSTVSCESKKDIFSFNVWDLIYTVVGTAIVGGLVYITNNRTSSRIKNLEDEIQNLVTINRELRSEYIEKSRIVKNTSSKKRDRERNE